VGLERRYHEERAKQPADKQSSPLLVIVLAAAIFGAAALLFDYRTAGTLGLGAVALAAVSDAFILRGLTSSRPKTAKPPRARPTQPKAADVD
jgi:hypothetical protein